MEFKVKAYKLNFRWDKYRILITKIENHLVSKYNSNIFIVVTNDTVAQIIIYKFIFELNKIKWRFIPFESVENINLNSCVEIKIKNIILKTLK